MKSSHNKRVLLELYADGELDSRSTASVERMLQTDVEARRYLDALREQRDLVRIPIEMATEDAAFEGLFARVMKAVDAAPSVARDPAVERLAIAKFDGEPLATHDAERVAAYLDSRPEARAGIESLRSMRELVRAPIADAASKADFGALTRRIDAALDSLSARDAGPVREAARVSFAARAWAFIGGWRTVAICATTAAVVLAFVRKDDSAGGDHTTPTGEVADNGAPTVVHNHYYVAPAVEMPQVRAVRYEDGFVGGFVPGDIEQGTAPVVWIVPDPIASTEGSGAAAVPVLQGSPL